ncbi:UNVERIFIED_CONTAM: hypothetical protein H355_009427 [Colinus virginianus]|nr:hypothetical protein H355_009427 [Colinus virginianus]
MATSGRISFTVRSILDLPEQDAHSMKQASDHHHHSAEKYSGSPYRGWIETDRNHYPSAGHLVSHMDGVILEESPRESLLKPPFVLGVEKSIVVVEKDLDKIRTVSIQDCLISP